MKKYIELYSGIGGFRLALEHYGWKCVFSSEINEYSIKTYDINFFSKKERENGITSQFDMDYFSEKNAVNNKIIKKLIPEPDQIDLIVGGFPCQTFSTAGKRCGMNSDLKNGDTRGIQFLNILKLIEYIKPKYILLENVKHIYNIDNKKTWERIKNELNKRGYHLPEKNVTLSPIDVGIPQNRDRAFIIAFKNEKPKEFIRPVVSKMKNIFQRNKVDEKYFLDSKLTRILNAWDEFRKKVKTKDGRTLPVIWIDEMLSKEWDDNWVEWRKKYINDMRWIYNNNKEFIDKWIKKNNVMEWGKRDKKFEWHAGADEKDIKNTIITLRQSGIRCKSYPIFPALVAIVQVPIIFDVNINKWRYLTPRENGNLQSFPKSYKICSNDQQAYKQFGNAVNVDVVKYLIKYYIEK